MFSVYDFQVGLTRAFPKVIWLIGTFRFVKMKENQGFTLQ